MPCNHKFLDYLQLERIDFQPTTLIIGTFNPEWDNLGNQAEWFYGRTARNYFWDILPRIYENINLRNQTHLEWKQFCSRKGIAVTDLLQTINDADINNPIHVQAISGYKDTTIAANFQDFTPVDIIGILKNHPTINHVYLTRQLGVHFWDNLWLKITEYCGQNNIAHQTLLTPSGSARFQMTSNEGIRLRDFIYNNWLPVWHQL